MVFRKCINLVLVLPELSSLTAAAFHIPAPSVLFGSVLDRYLPFMEPRELPWRPEPALPVQSGLGAGYPSLQQVGCPHNSPLRTLLT